MKDILYGVYTKTFRREPDAKDGITPDIIQSLIYVLKNMGADVGGYSFEWNDAKAIPWSEELEKDILKKRKDSSKKAGKLNDFARSCIRRIRRVQSEINSIDPDGVWLEYASCFIWYRTVRGCGEESAEAWVSVARQYRNIEAGDRIMMKTAERFAESLPCVRNTKNNITNQ